MKNFAEYAAYYNALYEDKDYHSEARYVSKLLSEQGHDVKTILNFGCGTGKHDFLLGESGYQITGADLSADMVKEASKNTPDHLKEKVHFIKGDFRSLRLNQKFDAVTALFHVMSYQNTNEEVGSAMETARIHLNEDGLFVFDFWYGPGVLSDPPVVRVKKINTPQKHITRIAQPFMHADRNIVDVNYELFVRDKAGMTTTITEIHSMRYFFIPELDLMLKQANFQLIHAYEWLTHHSPRIQAWNAIVVAKAI